MDDTQKHYCSLVWQLGEALKQRNAMSDLYRNIPFGSSTSVESRSQRPGPQPAAEGAPRRSQDVFGIASKTPPLLRKVGFLLLLEPEVRVRSGTAKGFPMPPLLSNLARNMKSNARP